MKFNLDKITLWLGILIAIIYNSWFLSYFLNPKISGIALASSLQASGQPFNWLFIALDVVVGILILLLITLVLKNEKKIVISLSGLGVFGVLTAVTALVPIHCGSDIRGCGYQSGQLLDIHDILGAIAAFALFIALLYATILAKNTRVYRYDKFMLWVWPFFGLSFSLVAIPAINSLSFIGTVAVIWQDIFLLVSGLTVILCTYSYYYLKKQK
ncbi:MAG: DUF998 domain-containing protein [Candidatus Saccharimonadales bacterium]